MSENFVELISRVKALSGLTPELEACLKEISSIVAPHLAKVTDAFYIRLIVIPSTSEFLKNHMDKLEQLKDNHQRWLHSLFEADIDENFAENMCKVGEIHLEIQLPMEFMTGSMALLNKELINIAFKEISDRELCLKALQGINAVTSLTLILMQKPYQLWN